MALRTILPRALPSILQACRGTARSSFTHQRIYPSAGVPPSPHPPPPTPRPSAPLPRPPPHRPRRCSCADEAEPRELTDQQGHGGVGGVRARDGADAPGQRGGGVAGGGGGEGHGAPVGVGVVVVGPPPAD